LTSAIADTSFIIDWVRYYKRDLIFNYYNLLFIPESVLNEIRTELTLIWISDWVAKGRIKILEETIDVRNRAIRLVEASRVLPIRTLDYPEAVCMILAKDHGFHVLTENGGVYIAKEFFEEYKTITALRAIDLLYKFYTIRLIENFKEELEKYIASTRHRYSKEVLRKYGIED